MTVAGSVVAGPAGRAGWLGTASLLAAGCARCAGFLAAGRPAGFFLFSANV